MKKTFLYAFVLLVPLFSVLGQDIGSHQWKDRVLIVLTTDEYNDSFQKQLQIFNRNLSGLEERKLKIYLTTPRGYKMFGSDKGDWVSGEALYNLYKQKDRELELVLIGLDGGIKNRTFTLTSAQEIFDVIDSMPMRKSELKRDKY